MDITSAYIYRIRILLPAFYSDTANVAVSHTEG